MSTPNGPEFPAADILHDFAEGKFVLSNLAAKRAKQLRDGAPPLVRVDSNHPLTIALAEIAAGKIRPKLGEETVTAVVETSEATLLDDGETMELGLLLPALDETETELVSTVLVGEEHDDEPEEDTVTTLGDLLADDDDEPADVASDDSDSLSLTDIAEQESAGESDEDSDD
jgi:DNA-directed RNA polymerase subunit omega